MKFIAPGLLVICVVLTILLIKEDRAVPGHYTGWGVPNMTSVITMLAWRWLAMTGAFLALLAMGRLSGWAPWGFVRVVMAVGGVFVLECSGFFLHSVFADERVIPKYRTIFAVLATALPLCAMAAGYCSRRWLFLAGVGAAMVAGIWGSSGETTFMQIKRPFLAEKRPNEKIDWLLLMANPMYTPDQLAEVFERIESRPDWIRETADHLDGPDDLTAMSAMYVLCRKAERLEATLQERCWKAADAARVKLDQQFQKEGHVTTSEALKVAEAVRGLAAAPGPARERHHAEFLEAVDYLKRARTDSSQIPDATGWDWVAQ